MGESDEALPEAVSSGGYRDATPTSQETPVVEGGGTSELGIEPLPSPEAHPPGAYLGPPAPSQPGREGAGAGPALRTIGRRARSASRAAAGQARHKGRSDGRIVKERLRHISPLSVMKISAIFFSCVALVVLVSTVILWQLARGTGVVDDAESFVTDLFAYGNCVPREEVPLGEDFREDKECSEGRVMVGSFEIDHGTLLQSVVLGGVVLVIAGTVASVFLVLLFNLLSDVTGGVRYSIVREPLSSRTGSTSGRGQR